MDFLTRGDAINILGRRVPISFLAVAATVLAAYMVLRARSRGSNIVAAGTPAPAPATSQALGLVAPPSVSSTYDPNASAIAQLQQSQQEILNQLSQQVGATTAATAPPPPPTLSPLVMPVTGAYGQQPHEWYVSSSGVLWQKWTDTGSGQTYQQPISSGWDPAQQLNASVAGGFATVTGRSPTGSALTATQAVGSSVWSGTGAALPAGVSAAPGAGAIKGGAGKVIAYGWTHRGPARGRVAMSAFRHPGNPLAPAA